ncbi:MAG: EAL domain-containing protein [Dissulfurispiraceae bacterium]|jgi:diguanylate cyclase (GGDEF)-like protein/PAS domain S-box-containing protein
MVNWPDKAESELFKFLETLPIGIIVLDADGKLYYANTKAREILGNRLSDDNNATELIKTFDAYIAYTDQPYPETKMPLVRALSGETTSVDDMEIRRNGKSVYLEVTGYPVYDSKGALLYAVAAFVNITPLKETVDRNANYILKLEAYASQLMVTEEVLRQAKQDWENTFNSIADMITIHDREFNIVLANAAAQENLNVVLSEICKGKCFEHFHGRQEPHTECPGRECLVTGKYTVTEMFEPKLNKFIEIRVTPRVDSKKDITGIIHVVRDISERKKLEQELVHQALYDALTNLPNRVLLLDRIQNLYDHRKRRKDLLFAVLFIDLDDFKKINDSFGHIVGDELLLSVAKRLSESTRPGDTISRFGGDEFVILLDDLVSSEDAIGIAKRVRESLPSVFHLMGHEVFTSASIGIAMSDMSSDNPQDLLRNADIAMYNAKTSGKANYALFDVSMHAAVLDSLNLENDLRKALARNELSVYYQPIVDIKTRRISGFEALARWLHPEQGFVPPAKFIPVAEYTGLIESIGKLVLKDACENINKLNSDFRNTLPLYVSVNLSAKQFNSKLPQMVSEILAETHFESSNLRLEITESTIMENIFVASDILHDLKALGVQIFLDDFGTGYSSLNYLHKFPVNALKIDPSFTRNIQDDTQAREILKSIQGLTNNLEMKMIIEGVEDQEQLTTFKDLNCQFIQGYLFSKPLPTGELFNFMQNSIGIVARVTDNTA